MRTMGKTAEQGNLPGGPGWLRLWAPSAQGRGLILGQSQIPHNTAEDPETLQGRPEDPISMLQLGLQVHQKKN